MADIPSADAPRGPLTLLDRFLDWKHLLLVGATCCLGLSLLFYLYVAATRVLVAYVLCPLSLMLFGVMLYRGKLLRHPDMKLLLAAFLWMNISFILNFNRVDIGECFPFFATSCAVWLLCYPLARVLSPERRMKSFDLLAGLWIAPVTGASVFGIILALTGTMLHRASDSAPLGVKEGRLRLILDPNMLGMLLCMALCLVLYLLLSKRRPFVKILLSLAGLCCFTALALTGSRTPRLALLPAAFIFAMILVCRLLHKRKKLWRLLIGAVAGAVFCAALLLGTRGIVAGFNALPAASSVSQQNGESPAQAGEPASIEDRTVSNDENVSGRFALWLHALGRLPEEKDVLLRGATPTLSLSLFRGPDMQVNHFHNAYLGVLLGYGLPGFLLMAAFLVYLMVCLCRLLFSSRPDLPAALRFLPAMLLPILAINLFEEMLFTRNFVSELDVWLAIIGGYTVVLSQQWRSNAPRPSAEPAPAKN